MAGPRLHTREAEVDDLEVMLAMRLRLQAHLQGCNADMWPLTDRGAERRRTYESWLAHTNARLLLLCEAPSREPVGMAVGIVQSHPGLGPGRSGFVDDVWVEPAHRGRGGATLLVRALLDFFEERGLEHVSLGWAVGNDEAEALWLGLGLRPLIVTATARLDEVRDRIGLKR